MIVPRHWAEGRAQHRRLGRQVTVRRFGWSDTSEADAQAKADERASAALARVLAGANLPRHEPKVAYNGAEGVPIREEVLERDGDTVVTRNAYGAHCLNTPNVLIADVDFATSSRTGGPLVSASTFIVGACVVGWLVYTKTLGIGLGAFGLVLCFAVAASVERLGAHLRGSPEARAIRRVRAFVTQRPEWNVHLYRTPAGLRVLATHRTFSPNDPAVVTCFSALSVDPIYARMCANQQCFRARLTAKPWRIGMTDHMRPRPGVWPVDPSMHRMRKVWIDRYERAAQGFAACRYVESIGSGEVDPAVSPVVALHNRRSGATSGMPIA